MSGQSNIAIVVPVLGDTEQLHALIDRVYSWSDQPRELIVVSAVPDARLREFCAESGCHYVESVRCRGAQLDSGARVAEAPVLWFLHADAMPNPSSLDDIALALAEGAEGGHFRFKFTGPPSWRKECLEGLIRLRIQLGGIPYGDQGIFVRRKVYIACDGFPHQPLFEEVALVKRLRARRHFRALESPIGVSPRRWERDGWIRRSLANRRLALRYMSGAKAEQLAANYDRTSEGSSNDNREHGS